METRFAIGQEVIFEKDKICFMFEITEIKIDHEGIWYAGHDEHGPVGWYLQKFLRTL
jgi:hypothetical protein